MEITIDKQNLTPRIKKTGVLVYSELTNTLFIKSKNRGVMQIGSSSSSGDFVEKSTTIDINGVVQDLSTSRTWTIFVPTKTSELTNDSGFITTSALSGYELLSNKSTSTSLGTSDSLYPTQNAVKQYVDTGLSGKQNTLGYTAEDSANKENTTLDTSTTKYPTNRLVKEAVDAKQDSLGFTPENVANKTTTITGNESSDTKYPTVKALYDWSTGLFATQSSLVGYVQTSRTITINGTAYDLSADRSWTIATPTASTGLTNTSGTWTSNLSTGISGGQSVIGGTASGNNLTLSSTSNATKGKILFGNSAYDEVNNRLGIGTTTPNWKLHVAGTVGADNIIAQFGDANKGVNIKTLANGTGLITSWNYVPTDPSAIAISAGANFGFNASPSNFYGMGLGAVRNGKYDIWFQTGTINGGGYRWYTGGTNERMTINKDGKVGIGTTTPTALLMLAAGTATANTAPLKFTTGTNLTTPENGAFEFDGTNLYFTVGGVRKTVSLV
jgi:hypothetical protein